MSDPNITEEPSIDPMEICRAAAFPFEIPLNGGGVAITHGLTKRELFAAMAMQGVIMSDALHPNDVAEFAVDQADRLLKELAK